MGDEGSLPPPLTKCFSYRQDQPHEAQGPVQNENESPSSKAESECQDGDGRAWTKRGPARACGGCPARTQGSHPAPCCSQLRAGHHGAAHTRPPALWGYSENRHVSKAPGQTPWRPSWARPTVDVHVALTAASVFLNGNSSLLQATTTDGRESSRALAEGQITAGGEKMS